MGKQKSSNRQIFVWFFICMFLSQILLIPIPFLISPIGKAEAVIDFTSDIRTDKRRLGASGNGKFYSGVWHQSVAENGADFTNFHQGLINDTSRSIVSYVIIWSGFESANLTSADPVNTDVWTGFKFSRNMLINGTSNYANLTDIITFHKNQTPRPDLHFRFDGSPTWAKPSCASAGTVYYPIINPYPDYFFAVRMFFKYLVSNMSYPAANLYFSPVNEPTLFYAACGADPLYDSDPEKISNMRELTRQAFFAVRNVSTSIKIVCCDELIEEVFSNNLICDANDYTCKTFNYAPWKNYINVSSAHNYPTSWSANGNTPATVDQRLGRLWNATRANATQVDRFFMVEWSDKGATANTNAITAQWDANDDAQLAFKRMYWYMYYDKVNATFITRMNNASTPHALATVGRGICLWIASSNACTRYQTYNLTKFLNWYGGQGWFNLNATTSTANNLYVLAFGNFTSAQCKITVFANRNGSTNYRVDFKVYTNSTGSCSNFSTVNVWNATSGARLINSASTGSISGGVNYTYTVNARNIHMLEFIGTPATITRSVSDTLTITETLERLLNVGRSLTDTVALSDSISRAIIVARAIAETFALSISLASQGGTPEAAPARGGMISINPVDQQQAQAILPSEPDYAVWIPLGVIAIIGAVVVYDFLKNKGILERIQDEFGYK